jgi:DnaA family protein
MPAAKQLGLPLHRDDAATFSTYVAGANAEALAAVRQVAIHGGAFIYLWGGLGTGRSHLLAAACAAALEAGRSASSLPLTEIASFGPAVCEDLDRLDLVCLDDLDAIAGNAGWEQSICHLYNSLRERRGDLILTATTNPADSPIVLADLKSRLTWGLVFQLRPLDETGRREVLARRVRARGIELTDEVIDYLLHRHRRDLASLCRAVDRLDAASMAAQRRLTLPFARSVLDGGE